MKAIILGFLLLSVTASCTKEQPVTCAKCSTIDSTIIYRSDKDSILSAEFSIQSTFDTCGLSNEKLRQLEYYGSRSISVSVINKTTSKRLRTVIVCR